MLALVKNVMVAECVGPIEAPAIGTETRRTSARFSLTVTGVKFTGVCGEAVFKTTTRKFVASIILTSRVEIRLQLFGESALQLPEVNLFVAYLGVFRVTRQSMKVFVSLFRIRVV